MDNILEILIPLAIVAVYFFGNMFSGKSKDEEEETPPSLSRQNDAGDGYDDEVDALERQRRVQEEIRRKIMERRGLAPADSESQPPQLAPAGQFSQEGRREVSDPHERRGANKHTREVVRENRYERSPRHEAAGGAGHGGTPPDFPAAQSAASHDSGMQAQLKRIEATKRQAERLQKQAASRRKAVKVAEPVQQRTGGFFTGAVRENLQDPAAARVAFVYGEVLGPPIALRKQSSSVPGLS